MPDPRYAIVPPDPPERRPVRYVIELAVLIVVAVGCVALGILGALR